MRLTSGRLGGGKGSTLKNLKSRRITRGIWACSSLWLIGTLCSTSLAELNIHPQRVSLDDAFARRQLLVSRDNHDVTRTATYTSRDPQVASVDAAGYVTPHQDGQTEIVADCEGKSVSVAVEVAGACAGRQVDFATEIVPLLSRFGCNSGGCHGKQGGQNGFQLSLFGFDQAHDHDALVKQGRGRRIFPASPEQSLLLLKVTGRMPHGGGQRMVRGDPSYQLLRQWIENGAPPAAADAPSVVKLARRSQRASVVARRSTAVGD